MTNFWRFFRAAFPASRVQHISDLHSKFALRRSMSRSMVDILSATAGIRRGKKKEINKQRRKKETTGRKYNGLPYFILIGRP